MPELEFKAPLVSNILIILLQVGISVVAINTLQPVVPILNNQLLADKTLMPKIWLALFPGLALINSLVSLLLLIVCRSLGKTILQIFAWSCTALNGILLLALLRIVLLVR